MDELERIAADAAGGDPLAAAATFAGGGSGEALPSVTTGGEIGLLAALVSLGFCSSNGEAKRKVAEGAVKLDGETVSDISAFLSVPSERKLSLGKKKHGLLLP